MTIRQKLKALAELGRISNLPTTVSNVLVGAALASIGGKLALWRVASATLAVALLYFGGMAMNDAMDSRIDLSERPTRPIPSGKVSLREAYVAVGLALLVALSLLLATGAGALGWGVALISAIVLYNSSHKKHPQAIFVMGACRGLVYVTAAKAIQPTLALHAVAWPALGLTLYVSILTYVARSERGDRVGTRRWLAFAMPLVVVPATLKFGVPALVPILAFGALMVAVQARAITFLFSAPARTMHAVMLDCGD